jgi:DNA polymerase III gamma/tau subunit
MSSVYEDIKDLIKAGNLNHTILLSGLPGTGKTTTARAIASYLFTRDPEIEFDLDNESCYVEVNSTRYNGKDDTKSLLDSVIEPPLARDVIVLVVDEAQGLTTQAQSVLLKPIEEPPKHLYIILCTTEPEKIRKDIRDRCKKFSFSQPTKLMMAAFIQNYALPSILDTLDSATIAKSKTNINNLNEATIKELCESIDEASYREAIRITHHYILTGNILLSQSEQVQANVNDVFNIMINPDKMSSKTEWRNKLQNALNSIDDLDAFRKYLCNYIATILKKSLSGIDFYKIECYTYAIQMLKNELAYSCQKADFISRLIDITLHTVNAIRIKESSK